MNPRPDGNARRPSKPGPRSKGSVYGILCLLGVAMLVFCVGYYSCDSACQSEQLAGLGFSQREHAQSLMTTQDSPVSTEIMQKLGEISTRLSRQDEMLQRLQQTTRQLQMQPRRQVHSLIGSAWPGFVAADRGMPMAHSTRMHAMPQDAVAQEHAKWARSMKSRMQSVEAKLQQLVEVREKSASKHDPNEMLGQGKDKTLETSLVLLHHGEDEMPIPFTMLAEAPKPPPGWGVTWDDLNTAESAKNKAVTMGYDVDCGPFGTNCGDRTETYMGHHPTDAELGKFFRGTDDMEMAKGA